jgi:hypothetical protein
MLKKIRETEKAGKQESKKTVYGLIEKLHTLWASDIIITITRDAHIPDDEILYRDAHDMHFWVLSVKFASC